MATTKKTDPKKKKPPVKPEPTMRPATPIEANNLRSASDPTGKFKEPTLAESLGTKLVGGASGLGAATAMVPSSLLDMVGDAASMGPIRRFGGSLNDLTQMWTDALAGVPKEYATTPKLPEPSMPLTNLVYQGSRNLQNELQSNVTSPNTITDVPAESSYWLGQLLGMTKMGSKAGELLGFEKPTSPATGASKVIDMGPGGKVKGVKYVDNPNAQSSGFEGLGRVPAVRDGAQAPAQYGRGLTGLTNYLRANPGVLGIHPDKNFITGVHDTIVPPQMSLGAQPAENPQAPMLESEMHKSGAWDQNAHEGSPAYQPGQLIKTSQGRVAKVVDSELEPQTGSLWYKVTYLDGGPNSTKYHGVPDTSVEGPVDSSFHQTRTYQSGQVVKLPDGRFARIMDSWVNPETGVAEHQFVGLGPDQQPNGSRPEEGSWDSVAGLPDEIQSHAAPAGGSQPPAPLPNTPSLTLPGGQSILNPFQRYMIGRYSDVNPESPAAESDKVLNAVRNKRFQERVPPLIERAAESYSGGSAPRLFNRLMAEWYKPEVVNTAAATDKATRTALQYERNVSRLLEPGRDPIDSGSGQFKDQMRNALFQLMAENPRRIPNANYFRVIEPGVDESLGIWRHDFANALGGVSLNVPAIARKYGVTPESEQVALQAVLAHELRHGEDSRRFGMKNLDWAKNSQSTSTELNAYASELFRLLREYDNASHPRLMGRVAGLGKEVYRGLQAYTNMSKEQGGVPKGGILNVDLRKKAIVRLAPRIKEMLDTNPSNAESMFQNRRAMAPEDVQEHAAGPIDFKNQQEKDAYNAVQRKKYQLDQQPAAAERAQLADIENEIERLRPVELNQSQSYLTPTGVDEDAMGRYTETVRRLEQLMSERKRLEEVIAQKSEAMDKWNAQSLDELDAYAEGKGLPDEVLMHAAAPPPTFQSSDLDKFTKAYTFLDGLQKGTTPEGQLYQKAQKLGANSMKLSDDERVMVKQIEQQKRDAFGDYKRLWDEFTKAKGSFDPETKQWSGLSFTDEAPKPEADLTPDAAPAASEAAPAKTAKPKVPKVPKPEPKPSLPQKGAYSLIVADPDETLRIVGSVSNSAGIKSLKREAAKHEGTVARWIEDENGDVIAQWDPQTKEMRDLKVSELKKNASAKESGEARARVEGENDKARAPQPIGPTLDDQAPGNHARVEKLNAKQLKEKEANTEALIDKASRKVGWDETVQKGKDAAWSKGMRGWFDFVNSAIENAPYEPIEVKRPDGSTTVKPASFSASRFRPSRLNDGAWNSVLTALRRSPQEGRSFVLVNGEGGPRFVKLSPEQKARELPAITEPAPEPKPAPPAQLTPPPAPKPPKPPNTEAFKYRPESQDLIVTFRGGRDYRVEGVDAETAKAYGEAESRSKYFNEHFKGKPGVAIYRVESDGKEVMVQSGQESSSEAHKPTDITANPKFEARKTLSTLAGQHGEDAQNAAIDKLLKEVETDSYAGPTEAYPEGQLSPSNQYELEGKLQRSAPEYHFAIRKSMAEKQHFDNTLALLREAYSKGDKAEIAKLWTKDIQNYAHRVGLHADVIARYDIASGRLSPTVGKGPNAQPRSTLAMHQIFGKYEDHFRHRDISPKYDKELGAVVPPQSYLDSLQEVLTKEPGNEWLTKEIRRVKGIRERAAAKKGKK